MTAAVSETARRLLQEGRVEEARPLLRRAAQENPADADTQFLTAVAESNGGDLAAAVAGFALAGALAPHRAEAFYNQGAVLVAMGRSAEAVAPLRRAVAVNPGFHKARQALFQATAQAIMSAPAPAVPAPSPDPQPGDPTISVIVCSITPEKLAQTRACYDALLGPDYEFIAITDARSLCEGYNRGAAQSRGDVLIFSHDDITVLTPDFRARLSAHMRRYDVAGVVGTTLLTGASWIDSGPPHNVGMVIHQPTPEHDLRVDVYGVRGETAENVQALDGLFFAARRETVLALGFDETTFDGFHCYDSDFTFRAYLAGRRVAVCHDLTVIHRSHGRRDAAWSVYAARFIDKHRAALPALFVGENPARYAHLKTPEQASAFCRAVLDYAARPVEPPPGVVFPPEVPVAPADPFADLLRRSGAPAEKARPGKRRVLHVGCGPANPLKLNPVFRNDDWVEIRLDIDPALQPDIVASISDLSAVPTGAVDAVWSSHNLEHLYDHEVIPALREFLRVLRPGGFLLLTLPDLQAVARHIADDDYDRVLATSTDGSATITPLDVVFGWRLLIGQGRTYMAHRTGFTLSRLARMMGEAGFSQTAATRGRDFDLWAVGVNGGAAPPADLLQQAMA